MQSDLKILRTKLQFLSDTVTERISNLEKLISELKQYQDDYIRALNGLSRIETSLQIEHHGSSSSTHIKTLEAQLDHLKQVKFDFESIIQSINRLNEQAHRYLYSPTADSKFTLKLKNDLGDLHDKLNQLRNTFNKKQYSLEVRVHFDLVNIFKYS